MILKIAYNNNCISLIQKLESISETFPELKLETYQEDFFKEKKKAFKLKGAFGTRQTPFAALYNDKKVPISVFYSESNECTFENISNKLKEFYYS